MFEKIEKLSPYKPGEQIQDKDYIKLNANENPFDVPDAVAERLCSYIKENKRAIVRYPDPDAKKVCKAISGMLNLTAGVLSTSSVDKENNLITPNKTLPFTVTPDMIYAGNGSDEVLSMLFYALFNPGDKCILTSLTYSFYPVYCAYYGVKEIVVPLNTNFTIDVNKVIEESNRENASIVLANPNAPTGISLEVSDIELILKNVSKECAVVVDEAYTDFNNESAIRLLNTYDNLIIVRTFSKSLGAAGLRLGYIVASPTVIEAVRKVKNSVNHFPLDSITQEAALLITENLSYYIENCKRIVRIREEFTKFLLDRGWKVYKSSTNFILTTNKEVNGLLDKACKIGYGEDLYKRIKESGILVRHFATRGVEDYIRITIGTEEEMEKLKEVIAKL